MLQQQQHPSLTGSKQAHSRPLNPNKILCSLQAQYSIHFFSVSFRSTWSSIIVVISSHISRSIIMTNVPGHGKPIQWWEEVVMMLTTFSPSTCSRLAIGRLIGHNNWTRNVRYEITTIILDVLKGILLPTIRFIITITYGCNLECLSRVLGWCWTYLNCRRKWIEGKGKGSHSHIFTAVRYTSDMNPWIIHSRK